MDAGSREHIKVNLTAARKALADAYASVAVGSFAEDKIDSAQAGIDQALEELDKPQEPTLTQLSTEIHDWANATFPDRPTHSAWVKMFEEIGEVIKDPEDPLEWADVLILFLDLAKIHKIDISGAVRAKLAVNRQRKWGVDSRGLMSHIEGEFKRC